MGCLTLLNYREIVQFAFAESEGITRGRRGGGPETGLSVLSAKLTPAAVCYPG
jgi:hypothetical protein